MGFNSCLSTVLSCKHGDNVMQSNVDNVMQGNVDNVMQVNEDSVMLE